MSQRKLTPLVILLVVVAVVCLLLSVVVQLGESIRYQQAPSGLKITYTAKELAFILGLPITALASLLWASLRSRHPIMSSYGPGISSTYPSVYNLTRARAK